MLRITMGLPGCGKTEEADDWVDQDPSKRFRVNTSDIRQMAHGRYLGTREQETMVIMARDAIILRLLRGGIWVVCDDSNLRWRYVERLRRLARHAQTGFEVVSYLGVDVQECVRRDSHRDDPTGEDVIVSMAANAVRDQIDNWRTTIRENGFPDREVQDATEYPIDPDNHAVVDLARRLTEERAREYSTTTTERRAA